MLVLFVGIQGHSAETADLLAQPLDGITVVATGISNMTAASAGDISQSQMQSEPLLRPAAILENVPGLIVTQHSGEGKANQYFLRAFNLDHGTDLALEVDDMPVNMPTHAHGQGYSDFNFVIPELAADLHYKKGPYYADEGDFATAGTARVGLVNEVAGSATVGFGEDGYRRELLMGSTGFFGGTLIGAGEIYHNDGPFDVPDDYNRLNGVVRYFRGDASDYFTLTAMAYSGQWNSTDQVPLRAIAEGLIDRFGTLNPTDGGSLDPLEPVLQPRQTQRGRPSPNVGLRDSLQIGSVVDVHLLPARPDQWRSDAAARRSSGVWLQRLQVLVYHVLGRPDHQCHRRPGTHR